MKAVDLVRIVAAVAGSLFLAMAAASAHADESCARLVVAHDIPHLWAPALDALRTEVAALPRSDCQPMTIAIERTDAGVLLVGTTADGRRAERSVSEPGALVATALGLLASIPSEAPPPSPRHPPAPASPVPAPLPAPAPAPTIEALRIPSTTAPPPFGVWVGLDAGVRLAAPTDLMVLDVEARADLLLRRWLLVATIRSAVVSCLGEQGVDCDVYNDVSLGVGVGRRIDAGPAALDFALEPSFVLMHMEYDSPTGNEAQSVDGTLGELRVDASARLAIPLGNGWHLTLTVDAGLAPSLLASPTRLELPPGTMWPAPPPFPAWTGGVRIGASGALL